jgi:hypothetical protein
LHRTKSVGYDEKKKKNEDKGVTWELSWVEGGDIHWLSEPSLGRQEIPKMIVKGLPLLKHFPLVRCRGKCVT